MLAAMTEPGPQSRRASRERSAARASVRAGAGAGALALMALSGAAAAAPAGRAAPVGAPTGRATPAGKVVRVERPQLSAVPRLCVMGMGRGQSMCLGQPRAGERVAIIDMEDKAVRGELVIESIGEETELAALGLCVSSGVRTVKGTLTPDVSEGRTLVGLRGARLDRRVARVLSGITSPSGRTDESVELALDADGNGRPDLVVTQYPCDAAGAPSSSNEGRCIDTYMEQHGAMRRVLQESVGPCR
jgi:hypothetical protein